MLINLAYHVFSHIKSYRVRRLLAATAGWVSQIVRPMDIRDGFIDSSFNNEDIDANRAILSAWEKEENKSIKSMTWFITTFDSPHAGVNSILTFMEFFASKGININIVLLGSAIGANYCLHSMRKHSEFAALSEAKIFKNPRISELPYTDAGIATRYDTAISLLKFNNTKSKFYFIQDDERLLSPEGADCGIAEATYRFGFIGITNAECLKEMYMKEFGGKAESYMPVPDNLKPVEITTSKEIKRVFFYARPDVSRNGFALGMDGLKEIGSRHPEIEIVAAGSDRSFDDRGLGIKMLGKVPLSQLSDLYSSCDVGIYILLSRHTGVIPFELMANGCATLTNRRCYEQSQLKHMENCVMFDLTPASIADAFDALYHDRKIYAEILANGLEFIEKLPTLEQEMDRIYRFMVT